MSRGHMRRFIMAIKENTHDKLHLFVQIYIWNLRLYQQRVHSKLQ